MATVYVGSARIDENGKASGGRAGDQTGREVSTQAWYKHSKGWRVFRAKSAQVAEKIAQDMQWACDNKHIGYDQGGRLTLYNISKPLDFNCKKIETDCETDCSALVRVCCAYAGIDLPNFRTPTEPEALLNSGAFVELTGSKYTDQSLYLGRGDILVTRTQGHTVVVLNNGSKAEPAPDAGTKPVPEGLHYGDVGSAVTVMQRALLLWDDKCLPRYGADGDFGSETEKAVKAFQTVKGLPVTGVYDQATRAALTSIGKPEHIIATGDVYVRSAPGTGNREIGILKNGKTALYQNEKRTVDSRDWYLIEFDGQNGWVSSKYAKLVDA